MPVNVPTTEEVEDALHVLRRDYLGDVDRLAQEFAGMWNGGEFSDVDSATETLDQMIDGTQRVIYTREAMLCLLFSQFDGEYEEQMGVAPENPSQAAFFAFRADVIEELRRLDIDFSCDVPVTPETLREREALAEMVQALEESAPEAYISSDTEDMVVNLDAGQNGTAIFVEVALRDGDWNVSTDYSQVNDEENTFLEFTQAVSRVEEIFNLWRDNPTDA